MGSTAFKGGLLLVVLVLVPLCAAASLCQFGKEYWSEKEGGGCVRCSRCEQPDAPVVLRPCQVHRDTVCGPLSSLPIHWPWANHRDRTTTHQTVTEHHPHRSRTHAHQHAHQHEKHRNRNEFDDPVQQHHPSLPPLPPLHHKGDEWPLTEWEHWLQVRLQHKKEDLLKRLLLEQQRNTFDDDDDDDRPSNEEDESTTHRRQHVSRLDLEIFEKLVKEERQRQRQREEGGEMEVTRRRLGGEAEAVEPFSAAETLVWDWQAVALVAAVLACLLFFMFAAVYSLLHVRQWRRLKDDLHLDVEDLAVRVSLMNNGGLNSPTTDGGNTNHYLEQLLAVKKEGENMSNVYVEKQPKAS